MINKIDLYNLNIINDDILHSIDHIEYTKANSIFQIDFRQFANLEIPIMKMIHNI